ncbi:MAG: hypothetical protein NUV46_00525 [Nanoarchaeota archaeon]|nr:hypothetical protein [Nanoarchaeota archaeon]
MKEKNLEEKILKLCKKVEKWGEGKVKKGYDSAIPTSVGIIGEYKIETWEDSYLGEYTWPSSSVERIYYYGVSVYYKGGRIFNTGDKNFYTKVNKIIHEKEESDEEHLLKEGLKKLDETP